MEQFSQVLQDATAAIGSEYYLLPIQGANPVYRERVYCYELYHQMRLRWPTSCTYRLNGEIDKRGHPSFTEDGEPKPDLLVHEPGTGNNYAVIEVKSSRASPRGIRKDLETLSRFTNELGYRRAAYLIYGTRGEAEHTLVKVQECAATVTGVAPIELWLHLAPSTPAELRGSLRRP